MALQLPLAAPPLDLLHGLHQLRGAARHARLAEAELAAVGVEREVAAPSQVALLHEPKTRSLLAEAGVLQGQQHRDRVAVVDLRHVHVAR